MIKTGRRTESQRPIVEVWEVNLAPLKEGGVGDPGCETRGGGSRNVPVTVCRMILPLEIRSEGEPVSLWRG